MGGGLRVQVLVVGAGPIGAAAARCAAEAGASVLLVDRREALDRSSCCAGLVSLRTLQTLGVSSAPTLQTIRAIDVHGPNGRTLDLTADHPKAIVIDRLRLERELHRRATDAGVDVRLGTEAVSMSGRTVVLRSSHGQTTVTASAVIGADGPDSRVRRWLDLPAPERTVFGAQAVIETDHAVPTDRVDVFLGRGIAPGFLSWAVPETANRLRVGLGVAPPNDPSEHLDRLLARRFPACRVVSRAGGRIPLSTVARSATTAALVVGDAAGQVKPLSGGGLYTGAVCARIAGRVAAEAALAGVPDDRLTVRYESAWRSAIGREVAFGRSIRRVFEMLSDRELNALVAACDDPDLLSFLAEHADIDRFHRLPDELAAHPALWGNVLRVVPAIVGREAREPADRCSVASIPRASL